MRCSNFFVCPDMRIYLPMGLLILFLQGFFVLHFPSNVRGLESGREGKISPQYYKLQIQFWILFYGIICYTEEHVPLDLMSLQGSASISWTHHWNKCPKKSTACVNSFFVSWLDSLLKDMRICQRSAACWAVVTFHTGKISAFPVNDTIPKAHSSTATTQFFPFSCESNSHMPEPYINTRMCF